MTNGRRTFSETPAFSAVEQSMNRVAVYARQSVVVDEGVARQVEVCQEHAARQGWSVVDTYVDNGVSGTKLRTEGTRWADMLADIDAGRVDTIVVVAIDRLTRRQSDLFELLEPRRTVRVVALRQGIDTATSTGRLMMGVLVSFAQQEIDTKAERAKPYREARRSAGHPGAGLTVYGYKWQHASARDAKGTRYLIDPTEAAHVRAMFEELLGGGTLGSVCRMLNAQGIRTRRGAEWGPSTVRRIVTNPMVAGLLPPDGGSRHYDHTGLDIDQCSPGAWDGIVAPEKVAAARALLVDPRRRTQTSTDRKWLLSGLALCGKCGGPIRSARSKEGHHAYRCVVGCFQRRGDILDSYARHVALQRLQEPDAAALVRPSDQHDIPGLKARKAALEAKTDQLLRLLMDSLITEAQFRDQKSLVDVEHATVSQDLTQALTTDPLAAVVSAEDVEAAWDALSLARQRTVLSGLLRLWIDQVGKGVRVTTLEAAAATTRLVWAVPGRTVFNPPAWGDSPELAPALNPSTQAIVASIKK